MEIFHLNRWKRFTTTPFRHCKRSILSFFRWKWFILALLLLAAAGLLCITCVLAGMRAGWLQGYYIVRVNAFPGAFDSIVGSLDLPAAKTGAPESISVYMGSYCRQIAAGQCLSHSPSDFDPAVGVHSFMIVLHSLGVAFTVASLAFSLHWVLRNDDRSRLRAMMCAWSAFGLVFLVSITATGIAYAVYVLLGQGVLEDVLSVEIGSRFFALVWLACTFLVLVVVLMRSWNASPA